MMLSVTSIIQEDDRDEIKCIFFSEFHPTAGPKIFSQVPEDYMKKEEFDVLHAYIITKPELKDRTITINALGHKIVGCPVCIDDSKYARNALIFNLCFVFDATASTQQYEMVVKKLADYLTTLEVESQFLSTEDTKNQLPGIMKGILEDINLLGSCEIPINECMSMRLKVVRPRPDPDKVLGHCVPICTSRIPIGGQWDLATQQLLPYIDGYRHVARIAAEADIDIHIVKACLQNLVYHHVIKIIPIFQYSNVYVTTPDIKLLAEDEDMQDECLAFVAKPGKVINLRDVFQLYCGLTAGVTVRDLCTRHNPHALGVDERKLIQFGLIKGLIRRLEKYPIKLPNQITNAKIQHLYRWFNGKHSYDEICCKNGISFNDLDEKVESDPSVVITWK